jgi:hypothetical protein
MKSNQVDAIVALDDYDVEKATYLRENLRLTEWDKRQDGILGINDANES